MSLYVTLSTKRDNTIMTEVVVYTSHYSAQNAVTYICDANGTIASFPYNPSSAASIAQRIRDFWQFSVTRNIDVIEVLPGSDLVLPGTVVGA